MSPAGRSVVRAGDSAEQRRAEPIMLKELGARLGIDLQPKAFNIKGGVRVKIDGVSEKPLVLCEAYAHQGTLKSAQRQKLIADAFRLVYVERMLGRRAHKVILVADEAVAAGLAGRTWVATALKRFGVKVEVVKLSGNARNRIRAAQKRQYR